MSILKRDKTSKDIYLEALDQYLTLENSYFGFCFWTWAQARLSEDIRLKALSYITSTT